MPPEAPEMDAVSEGYIGRHRPALGRWDAYWLLAPQRYSLGYELTQKGWAEALGMPEDQQQAIGIGRDDH